MNEYAQVCISCECRSVTNSACVTSYVQCHCITNVSQQDSLLGSSRTSTAPSGLSSTDEGEEAEGCTSGSVPANSNRPVLSDDEQ